MVSLKGRENNMYKNSRTGMRRSYDDKIFDIVNCVLLSILTLVFLYPLIYVLSCSFSNAEAVWSGKVVLFPVDFNISGYIKAFQNEDIWRGYLNSIFYTAAGTIICVGLSLITAYPLSRKDFMPRNIIMFFYVFCMYFNGGLIPTYLLIKSLGMVNSIWVLIIPGAVSAWNVILIRTYFSSTIPAELHEAAFMDGCSNTRFFLKMVLPLSKPIIAVMVLFTAVSFWNSYFTAMIYINQREKYPLQVILREILVVVKVNPTQSGSISASDVAEYQEKLRLATNLRYAVIILASVPVLIMYPFVQKYFIRGIMVGAIKS